MILLLVFVNIICLALNRARKIEDNEIKPFVDLTQDGEISSIRSSQGNSKFL